MRGVEGSHFVVFRIDGKRSSSLRGQRCEVWKASASLCLESMKRNTKVRGVEGGHFVVFRIDEERSSSLRGQRCEVWEASASLSLESVNRNPLRRAVGLERLPD